MLTCTAYNPVAATTIVLTPDNGTAVPANLGDNTQVMFKAPITNTGPINLQFGNYFIAAVKESDTGQVALAGGEMVAGTWQQGFYDPFTSKMVIAPFTTCLSHVLGIG